MKQKLMAALAILLCLGSLAGGTLAYFTDSEEAHNVITSGKIDIALREWADDAHTKPYPGDTLEGAMPGDTVTKIVQVENICAHPAFIRVKVALELRSAEDEVLPEAISLDINETDWFLGEDGYYYYKEALPAGKTTEPLFTRAEFDAAMDNRYRGCTAKIDVTAYAVQSQNNGESPQIAAGWPEG